MSYKQVNSVLYSKGEANIKPSMAIKRIFDQSQIHNAPHVIQLYLHVDYACMIFEIFVDKIKSCYSYNIILKFMLFP